MSFIASLLAKIGGEVSNVGTNACLFWFMDEPNMPKSLIEK